MRIRIGVIGFGYWGPNLVRNFASLDHCTVKRVADLREDRLNAVVKAYPSIQVSSMPDDIIDDPEIDGIVIALPTSLHYEIARKALMNGKHVLIEKPMTDSLSKALDLTRIAQDNGRILMVDHTFLYTGAVKKMKELITSRELGEIQYFDSVRINLGLFQHDINVLWDLAPHDISILEYLIEEKPCSVVATGICHTSNGIENIAYITLFYHSNKIAHINVSWTSPVKVRQIIIGGTKKMVLYNDLETTEKIKIYDSGYRIASWEEQNRIKVDYRTGDIYVPKLDGTEALTGMASDFAESIMKQRQPVSNHAIGSHVVGILEAAEKSIKNRGKEVQIDEIA